MPVWQLFVKSMQGKTVTVDIDDPEPKKLEVATLKKKVKEKTGIPEDEQVLIYGGKQFEDGKILGDYPSLDNNATLFLVMRLKGGATGTTVTKEERTKRIDRSLMVHDTCIISFEDCDVVKMPCRHTISPDWLIEYCWREIDNKKFEIHCPHCNREWTVDVLAKYGGADRNELTLLEEGLSRNYCDQNNDITECPGCRSYCTRFDKTKNSMLCRICTKSKGKTYRFCFECHDEWNNGSDENFCGNKRCESISNQKKNILRNCEEKEVVGVKCPSRRQCPNDSCKALVEHAKDCKHMQCKMCKTEFCFICLRKKSEGSWLCGSYRTKCTPAPRQA